MFSVGLYRTMRKNFLRRALHRISKLYTADLSINGTQYKKMNCAHKLDFPIKIQ